MAQGISKNILGIGIAAILVIGGGMFLGGMKYGESKTPSTPGFSQLRSQFAGRSGNGIRFRGGTGGSRAAAGTILSMDSQSITVKLQSGGTRTVYYSGSTTIGKMDTGSSSDLKTGDRVAASGTPNPDGSVAAKNIEILPAGSTGGFFGFGGGNGGAGAGNNAGGNRGGSSS